MASVLTTKRNNPCSYCGSQIYGDGCKISPNGRHYHPNDPNSCRFCGSPSRGKGCRFNPPTGLHVRGMGGRVCVYCGSTSRGKGCQLNPIGIHDTAGSEITPESAGNNPSQHSLQADQAPVATSDISDYSPQTQATIDAAGTSMRGRCMMSLRNERPMAWQVVGAIAFVAAGIWLAWSYTDHSGWRLAWAAVVISLTFIFRNPLAMVVERSYFGLPALIIALLVRQYADVDVGNILTLAALVLWLWPLWPFILILLLAFVAAAPHLAKFGGARVYGGRQ